MVMILPLLSLMITGIAGFSLLGLGIKNISQAQKICILTNLSGQQELKAILKSLLALNRKAVSLRKKKKALQISLRASLAAGLLGVAADLKRQILFLKVKQKALFFKQRALLRKGDAAKGKALKKLRRLLKKIKAKNIKEDTAYKKAFALFRKKLGPYAETYHPLPDFPKRQKTVFSWDMGLFFPLSPVLSGFDSLGLRAEGRYKCGATLEKKSGVWEKRLFH